MTEPIHIDPGAFYDAMTLRRALGMRPGSIDRARRSGELKSTRRGGRVLFLGSWVQSWLTGEGATGAGCVAAETAVTV